MQEMWDVSPASQSEKIIVTIEDLSIKIIRMLFLIAAFILTSSIQNVIHAPANELWEMCAGASGPLLTGIPTDHPQRCHALASLELTSCKLCFSIWPDVSNH